MVILYGNYLGSNRGNYLVRRLCSKIEETVMTGSGIVPIEEAIRTANDEYKTVRLTLFRLHFISPHFN